MLFRFCKQKNMITASSGMKKNNSRLNRKASQKGAFGEEAFWMAQL
jgi:hypothetical protein